MGRQRIELGAKVDAAIVRLGKQGRTAEQIAKALKAKGERVAVRTVSRRLLELGGKKRVGRVAKASKKKSDDGDGPPSEIPLPKTAEEIPEGLSVEMLHRMRAKAEAAANHALKKKDLATFASMGRLMTSLTDAIRKATPAEKPDPNENPDMRALAELVATRLHKLIDQVAGTEE